MLFRPIAASLVANAGGLRRYTLPIMVPACKSHRDGKFLLSNVVRRLSKHWGDGLKVVTMQFLNDEKWWHVENDA